MKKFRRIIGIILMAFNGIGIVAVFGTAGSFIKDNGLGIMVLLLAVYGGLFCLGYRLYTTDRPKRKTEPVSKAPQKDAQDAAPVGFPDQRAVPDSAKNIGIVSAYTVIAAYLELPFHDGDNFFLFKKEEDARQFIQLSGRKDLSVRNLDDSIFKRELTEYLCCGYTGAVIKNDLSTVRICSGDQRLSSEKLIRDFGLDLSSVGCIAPAAGKRMHNYLNQMSYTYRKYGPDMSAVPAFWKEHLQGYKDETIRHLLCADLCLPSGQSAGNDLTISVMMVSMPSGQKWAALFTDMFAIFRYTRKPPNSVAFPNLLSDVAKDIRTGKITGVEGIMINPGREEFKMTADEIARQETWLDERPGIRSAYFEKPLVQSPVPDKKSPESKPAAKPELEDRPSENASDAPPVPAAETWQKIDLSENITEASVTPSRSFFMGLLPGEKPYSDTDDTDADENRPDTHGYTKLDQIGFPSRWSEYYYDPKYRRIILDQYTVSEKTGKRWYHGRKTILPLDLIDQYNQYPEDRNPDKTARIQRIQKLMQMEGFGD